MARKRKKPEGNDPENPVDPADVPLNDDERLFVEEYLIDRNASRAYRTLNPHCTYRSAQVQGYRMMHLPNVEREINAAIHAQVVRTRITADRVLKETARVAFSDIYEVYDPVTGRLRHPRHIPYETRKAIASIKVVRERRSTRSSGRTRTMTTEQEIEYRFWPKMEALGKLCKHLGLDTEITPLEALLRALPAELAAQVRGALLVGTAVAGPSTNGHAKVG